MELEKDVLEIEEELGRGEICRKNRLALDAMEATERIIMNRGEITQQEAIFLGSIYVSYHMEALLHNEDRIWIEIEAAITAGDDPMPIEEGYNPQWIREHRMELESTLFDAAKGNYSGIKAILARDGQRTYRSDKKLGTRLVQMADLIPETGTPFIPPNPAWMGAEHIG